MYIDHEDMVNRLNQHLSEGAVIWVSETDRREIEKVEFELYESGRIGLVTLKNDLTIITIEDFTDLANFFNTIRWARPQIWTNAYKDY